MGDSNFALDISDDEFEENLSSVIIQGVLLKWTNYIHGWQERYFILKSDSLIYYRTYTDVDVRIRGSIVMSSAIVKQHEFDELRFDVSFSDGNWYLRANSPEDRQNWITAFEIAKREAELGSSSNLVRNGSLFSLQSHGSITSSSSHGRILREKINELETFRDILVKQVESLQAYFDKCVNRKDVIENGIANIKESTKLEQELIPQTYIQDFKGEAITFKATTAGVISTLQHCLDIIQKREDLWSKKLEREIERRTKAEENLKRLQEKRNSKFESLNSPDFQEGPHSQLTEEMWFDAVESAYRNLEILDENNTASPMKPLSIEGALPSSHPYSEFCEKFVKESLAGAFTQLNGDGKDGWELLHTEGEMRVYRKEMELDGVVTDPLKATHTVSLITANELCSYFFNPDIKMEWEHHILEWACVLERINSNTAVVQSLCKRVWPTTQRDVCYCAHIRHVTPDLPTPNGDTWIVVCFNVDHPKAKKLKGVMRAVSYTSFVCQTIVKKPIDQCTREDIQCKIWYTADVNPGGWAPARVLREVYKREYPAFLRRFSSYVINKTAEKDILW